MYSTPILLGEAIAGEDNVARLTATIPANIELGLVYNQGLCRHRHAEANPLLEKPVDIIAGSRFQKCTGSYTKANTNAATGQKAIAPIAPAPESHTLQNRVA